MAIYLRVLPDRRPVGNDGGSDSIGGGGGGGGSLYDGAHMGTGICFHHYTYGCSATRCKPPCLFAQGNGAAGGGN
jgi:hypothetical protein